MLDEILRIHGGVFVRSPDQCLQIRPFSPAVITTVFAMLSACNGDVVLATPLHCTRDVQVVQGGVSAMLNDPQVANVTALQTVCELCNLMIPITVFAH
jgi:hypothetical protein